jgi:hypothetical protein
MTVSQAQNKKIKQLGYRNMKYYFLLFMLFVRLIRTVATTLFADAFRVVPAKFVKAFWAYEM